MHAFSLKNLRGQRQPLSRTKLLLTWSVLQRLRSVVSGIGNVPIPASAHQTFEMEGAILEQALAKSFRIGNEAINLYFHAYADFETPASKECKSDYPLALQVVVEGSGSSRGSDLRADQREDFRGRACGPTRIFLNSGANVRSNIRLSPLTWTCCQLAYRWMHSGAFCCLVLLPNFLLSSENRKSFKSG